MGTIRCGIASGNNAVAGGPANGRGGECVLVETALGGDAVEVGCARDGIAVATKNGGGVL